jgi:YidC/Oxa1 family membrane protein insertase
METIGLIWNTIIIQPMINGLVLLYIGLFHNFGLAIIAFTVIVRLILTPLTLRQIRQTRAMSELQPKLQQLQKKWSKDKQKLSQETMRAYKEAGISPIGCLGPMIVQLPIWIGLYQALIQTLPTTPDSLVGLAGKVYPFLAVIHQTVPLNSHFFGLDLARNDPTPILPLLVGVTTWVQQKMTTPVSPDPRQASTNRMMLWMMPIMLAFFAFQFPSGLALYWVVSNLIGIGTQYFITGWAPLFAKAPPPEPEAKEADSKEASRTDTEKKDDGKPAAATNDPGGDGKDGGGGDRSRADGSRRKKR